MKEDDHRQLKGSRRTDVPAASSSAASASGGGGGESDEERQRRAERERALCDKISATEGLPSYMMAFLPINLMVQQAKSIWQHAAPELSDVTISSATKEERSFWQHVHLAFVAQLAARLTRLTIITLRYPVGFPSWCLDVFVAMVEGHIAGRRAADLGGGTLHILTIQEGVQLSGAARQTQKDWEAGTLGQFISSSRSLRRVDGSFGGGVWARVFDRIPVAPTGQQGGPLAQLESIGTIVADDNEAAAIDRLREVLLARGCRRSLEQLHVRFYGAHVGRRTLPVLLALDRLVGTCCRPDAPLTFTTTGRTGSDLSIFYHPHFPTRPSPSFKTMLQQLAQQATSVYYIFTQDGLANPHANPGKSAIDIASSLSFDEAETVEVLNAGGFHPPANTPSLHPTIITHLQPFSTQATRLCVASGLGGAVGELLAAKMPKEVRVVDVERGLGGEERVGVLAALEREREVDTVVMGAAGVDQLVEAAGRLPTIKSLDSKLPVADDVEDASSLVRGRLSSVIPHIRGLQGVRLTVERAIAGQHDSILASLPLGANIDAFSVRGIGGSVDATWTTVTAVRNP
ncbi:unnamed protein product [Vitrella brassicaformis CCMP3155]|uniref:Uncharacterized protein n=1 Tax=Vitrella brassicaformis (strain CCMP3155) TaxID=1169540 RepID=A0A0G4GMU1_VITBC|nr:unnamed protein product [Vitrella brassicaformis CCMP3155]|eukprot:CEM31525.1 unnamed protein product [Vitrella brassicaformis CCMP3155]